MPRGKQPRSPAKVPNMLTEWRRWWGCTNSQEVGLEAAILERVRNSSLVECPRADNVPGLKRIPEAADVTASRRHVVGERSGGAEKPAREHGWSEPKRECRNE